MSIHTAHVMDLWVRQPMTFLGEALQEGYRNFVWHIGIAMAKRLDPIARLRAGALGYGENTRLMLVDYAGATEYGLFSSYDKPIAVYPTWTWDEDEKLLRELCRNPVSENPKFTDSSSIRPEHRPVKGQKHRVVIHRIANHSSFDPQLRHLMYLVRDLEAEFDVEIFISGLTSFDYLFNWNLSAGDYRPNCMTDNQIDARVILPSGKVLRGEDQVGDARYQDWFDLLGITQFEVLNSLLTDRLMFPRFCLRAAQWARRNFELVQPFVGGRRSKMPDDHTLDGAFFESSSDAFILPAARRRVMRNIGMEVGSLDKFMCDTCILQNTCTLYRVNSVCTVKGSDGVALADSFGTRNASRIIDGLSALLQRQAERLEDSMAAEKADEPNPDITRQMNSVFANAVKLAKLIDPTLNGGPKMQVNIGVGAGGNAQIVASADPRQITSDIVRELEARGIPRDQITGDMVAGYLKTMGVEDDDPKQKAIGAAKANAKKPPKSRTPPEEDQPSGAPIVVPIILDGELA